MSGNKLMWSLMLGGAMIAAGCDSADETPAGTPTAVPQATEEGVDAMKDSTENASERAKDAAGNVGDAAQKQAEGASDALKKGANAAAESAAANPAAADAVAKVKQVTDYISQRNYEMAEKTLAAVEANKASLPASVQSQITNARTMLDTAKKGAAATAPATK